MYKIWVKEKLKPIGLIIISNDCVAADAVCTSVMGINVNKVEHVVLSEKAGLGNASLDNIEILGENIIIEKEVDLFLPKSDSKYDVYLTIKHNLLIPSAGVDESNTNGYYVMWPKDP